MTDPITQACAPEHCPIKAINHGLLTTDIVWCECPHGENFANQFENYSTRWRKARVKAAVETFMRGFEDDG